MQDIQESAIGSRESGSGNRAESGNREAGIGKRGDLSSDSRLPTPDSPCERLPDALIVPETLKVGSRQIDRINSVLDVAEPILGVDRSRGERGYIRRQPNGRLFITKHPDDTLLHPVGHPLEGRERYRWSARPDGIELGHLGDAKTHGNP